MTRDQAIAKSFEYFDSGEFLSDIKTLIKIPTESQTKGGLKHCEKYLREAISPVFKKMGFGTKMFANPVSGFGPVLLATRIEDPSLPTILGYGHGDVILGMEERWADSRNPWIVEVDGERVYGRGTADNKSQHWINIIALKHTLETRGALGFNAKFVVETGEENGSLGLGDVIAQNLDDFEADVFIASDGPRVKRDFPTICLGSRGAINFDLVCDLRTGGHHSGNWGGALRDPAIILSNAISCISSSNGKIDVEEWRPPEITPRTRDLLRDIEIDSGPGGPIPDDEWGEPGLTAAENVYAWNNFCVLAMTSGNPAQPVNAVSPSARAHCQFRYIAGTDHTNALTALREHLDERGFGDVKIEAPPEGNRGGYLASRTEPDNHWVERVIVSMTKTCSKAPAVIPQMGGSICNDLFTDLLGLPAIWVPHSYSGCSQHAPNEHILLPVCREGLQIMTGLYWDLGVVGSEEC